MDREPARSLEASSARQSFHEADRGDLGRLSLILWKICSMRLRGLASGRSPRPESQGAAGAVKADSDGRARSAPGVSGLPFRPFPWREGGPRGVAS